MAPDFDQEPSSSTVDRLIAQERSQEGGLLRHWLEADGMALLRQSYAETPKGPAALAPTGIPGLHLDEEHGAVSDSVSVPGRCTPYAGCR